MFKPYDDSALGVECAWPSPSLRLGRGEIIDMRDAAGHTVFAHEGFLWITEENSGRDVLLRPGQSFRLAGPGLAIVEAFTDASISLGSPQA